MRPFPPLLAGKTVMVTGGASGIGRAICHSAAIHGAGTVIVADLRRDPREGGEATESLVTAAGGEFMFLQTDVRSKSSIADAVAAAASIGHLDVMVCNAGITCADDGMALDEEKLRDLVDINLNGVYLCAQAAGLHMIEHHVAGSIVIVSSMGGVRGAAATSAYSATKAAGRLMAASMADELGPHGIRVNAICPGLIDTALSQSNPAVAAKISGLLQRTPLRRMGRPEEIGATVAWLASDMASYVNGTSIVVDGGLTAVL